MHHPDDFNRNQQYSNLEGEERGNRGVDVENVVQEIIHGHQTNCSDEKAVEPSCVLFLLAQEFRSALTLGLLLLQCRSSTLARLRYCLNRHFVLNLWFSLLFNLLSKPLFNLLLNLLKQKI